MPLGRLRRLAPYRRPTAISAGQSACCPSGVCWLPSLKQNLPWPAMPSTCRPPPITPSSITVAF